MEDYQRRTLLYRDVWVSLPKLFPSSAPPREPLPSFVDVTGEVEGVLVQWHRGVRGEWLGEVNYTVQNYAGRPQYFARQLVSADAGRARRVAAEPHEGPL